jgi:ElaA protein
MREQCSIAYDARMRHWRLEPFSRLSAQELYALVQLREAVFIVEQRCAYRDADGLDPLALHLFCVDGEDEHGVPRALAAARLFAPGVRAPEAVIGRVVTATAARGGGLGRELMTRALGAIAERHGADTPVWLGAQKYVERFYRQLGFVRDGDDYLEDDILHLPMRRPGRL